MSETVISIAYLIFAFVCVHVCIWVYVCICEGSTHPSQKRAADLKLELKVVVSHQLWVLVIELPFSSRVGSFLNCWAASPVSKSCHNVFPIAGQHAGWGLAPRPSLVVIVGNEQTPLLVPSIRWCSLAAMNGFQVYTCSLEITAGCEFCAGPVFAERA